MKAPTPAVHAMHSLNALNHSAPTAGLKAGNSSPFSTDMMNIRMTAPESARTRVAWRWALTLGAASLLAACGGGGGSSVLGGGGSGPTVSTLSAFPLQYGRNVTVSISGQGLDQNIQLDPGNVCTDMIRVAGGTDATQSFTCRIGSIGEYNMTVRDAGGKRLATLLVSVPVPQVTMVTSRGSIVMEMDLVAAPRTVDNFLSYVNGAAAFYRNTIVHRAQAGSNMAAGLYTQANADSQPVLKDNTRSAIVLESDNGLKNLRATVAMDRDPVIQDSARTAFFINLKDNPEFDRQSAAAAGYAVFARVVSGMEVADGIGDLPVRFNLPLNLGQVPATPLPITSMSQTR
jgi:cyclophilin family peptidyl-prolyl cis-trans isomerase